MICVAIQEKDVNRCLEAIEKVEMAEIRIDLAGYDAAAVRKVFSGTKKPLLATCRPAPLNDEERMKLLKAAIESGASMVDIEIESDFYFTSEMVSFAKKHGCKVIVSYHNFEATPGQKELEAIVKDCYAKGADIAKIATMVRSPRDSARLLGLYASGTPLVALGMGELGKVTRVAASLLGAAFTFAAIDDASITAPGQVSFAKLNSIIDSIKK